MLYSQLGNTGTFVSRICFGTMTFGGAGTLYQAIGGLTQENADALVSQSLDAGVNFFDTANVYAAGEIMSGNILTKGYLAGFGMTIGAVFGELAGRMAATNARG